MRLDVWGQPLDIDVSDEFECRVCGGRAKRQASAYQGQEVVYHHYRCRADRCPAGGVIVDHDNSATCRRVGPVFGDRDLAVRLATVERSNEQSDSTEAAP